MVYLHIIWLYTPWWCIFMGWLYTPSPWWCTFKPFGYIHRDSVSSCGDYMRVTIYTTMVWSHTNWLYTLPWCNLHSKWLYTPSWCVALWRCIQIPPYGYIHHDSISSQHLAIYTMMVFPYTNWLYTPLWCIPLLPYCYMHCDSDLHNIWLYTPWQHAITPFGNIQHDSVPSSRYQECLCFPLVMELKGGHCLCVRGYLLGFWVVKIFTLYMQLCMSPLYHRKI